MPFRQRDEAMRVVTLASGSSGNATLVEAGTTRVLVDAGLSAKIMAARLRQAGCQPGDLAGIVLTHEHGDHTTGAVALARQFGIPLLGDARTLAAVLSAPGAALEAAVADRPVATEMHAVGSQWRLGALQVTSFAISHDAVAPCGYLIGTAAWRACIVTDCGELDDRILGHLRQANLIIIEANHDRARLLRGPYTPSLKKRILSPTGHLSNDQAAEALWNVVDDTPRWIWLAHLSRTNNTPDLAHTTVTGRLGARRLRVARVAVLPHAFGLAWDSARLLHPTAR
jgi:phosphoribosyl 1,2-cyclic phosphodiesterase